MAYDLTCGHCGGTFEAARSDATFCSSACRQKAYRQRSRPEPIRNSETVTAIRNGERVTGGPVPVIDQKEWLEYRFKSLGIGRYEVNGCAPKPLPGHRNGGTLSGFTEEDTLADLIEHYIFDIASIVKKDIDVEDDPNTGRPDHRNQYRIDDPLPEVLPAEITPDDAEALASWFEPALDRAAELLSLLQRRASESEDL